MGKFESNKGTQAQDQGARSPIPMSHLQALSEMGSRNTGVTVTAGAIGMGLASQSASQDGLLAFAATLPGGEFVAPVAKARPQAQRGGGPVDGAVDIAAEAGVAAEFQSDSPLAETGARNDSVGAEGQETAASDLAAAPAFQENQQIFSIAGEANTPGTVAVSDTVVAVQTDAHGGGMTAPLAGAGGNADSEENASPDDQGVIGGLLGEDGVIGGGIGSIIGDDGLVDDLLGGVLGEGGVLGSVLGENGVVDAIIGEDGILAGVLGDGSIIESVLGDGGLIDVVLGDDGLVDGVLGDGGLVDGVVDGVLGNDGLVDGVLGDGGLVDGVLDGVLGDEGLVGGVLGEEGVLGGVLGEGGVLGSVLGENGALGVLTGEDGVLSGVLGDGGVIVSVLGDDGLVDAVLGDDGIVGGLLGDGGLVDGVLGEDGVVGGLLGDDGVVDAVLGDGGLLGGLLGGSAPDVAAPEAVEGVVETVEELADSVLGEDGVVGGLLGDDGVVDAVLGDGDLLGGLLGGSAPDVAAPEAVEGVVETVEELADGVLGEDGVVGGLLGDDGVVDAVLGDGGLLGGLLGGSAPDVAAPEAVEGVVETVEELADGVLGEDGVVGGLLGDDGVVDAVLGDGGLLGGSAPDVTAPEAVDGVVETVEDLADGVLGEDGVVGGLLGDDGVVDAVLGDGGLLGGLLGGSAPDVAAPEAVDGVVETVEDLADGVLGEDGVVGGLLDDDGVVDAVLGDGGLLGGDAPDVEDVLPEVQAVDEPVEDAVETVEDLADEGLGDEGVVGGLLGDGNPAVADVVAPEVVEDVVETVEDLADGVLGGLLGGDEPDVEDVLPEVQAVDEPVADVVEVVSAELVEDAVETVADLADEGLGDEGVVGGLFGDGTPDVADVVAPEVVEGVVETVEDLADGVLGGLLGGDAPDVEDVLPEVQAVDEPVSDVADNISPDVVEDAAETVEDLEDTVLADAGAADGLLGETPVAGVLADTLPSAGGVLTDGVIPMPVDNVDEAPAAEVAEEDDEPVIEDLPAGESEGDDGFLDTLVAGIGDEAVGPADEIFELGESVLDGLLGEADVFGINVVENGGEGDDLFAGLTGGEGLSGSLIEQGVLQLSDPVDTGETDEYIDNLLNDILAGGVSDITGEEAAFDSLLGNDVEVEEVGEVGELVGTEVGEVAEATAVEDALGILFDQGAEQGHNSPFGGLLGGLTNDDSA